MKSKNFDIKPKVRALTLTSGRQVYVATWRDPGNLIQNRNASLRYVKQHTGMGSTIDAALIALRQEFLRYSVREQAKVAKVHSERVLDKFNATSNLPWWKRLFRV